VLQAATHPKIEFPRLAYSRPLPWCLVGTTRNRMPAYVLKCEGCNRFGSFLIYEGELPEAGINNAFSGTVPLATEQLAGLSRCQSGAKVTTAEAA